MLFNSIVFLLFYPTVFILYWFVLKKNYRVQNVFLIVVSYIFYGWWDWRFLSLIVVSSLIDYSVGIKLFSAKSDTNRRRLVLVSILSNLGILGFFKYFNFFIDSFIQLIEVVGFNPNIPLLNVILPVGISFYTFQSLSYSIDIYRRELEPTRDAAAFFAFVAFFPQLVAGPIERAKNLLPQFLGARSFDIESTSTALRQILWGFFKKIVIADRLALIVEPVFSSPENFRGLAIILATVAFAFQIYCDFSGYSDIAIGTAKLLGFDLTVNFKAPYFAQSVREFWRRWHISLSTWFRDYVYIPLGGSRVSPYRLYPNLMLTFVISGLWHGANWTYLVWGTIHGGFLISSMMTKTFRDRLTSAFHLENVPELHAWMRRGFVFFITCVGWVFFRSPSVSEAIFFLRQATLSTSDLTAVAGVAALAAAGLSLTILGVVDWFVYRDRSIYEVVPRQTVRWAIYIACVLFILIFGRFTATDFIYFQF